MADINKVLALPANKGYSGWGAQMGRRDQKEGRPERLCLQRLRLHDGAYDSGGAYWGSGTSLWCAFSPDGSENEYMIRVFVRARTREEAKQLVLEELDGEGWSFFR